MDVIDALTKHMRAVPIEREVAEGERYFKNLAAAAVDKNGGVARYGGLTIKWRPERATA